MKCGMKSLVPCTGEVGEWISNFIPHFIMDVITYPCWDYIINYKNIENNIKRHTVYTNYKNIENNIKRHAAYTIVSWPIPKQWVIVHTSDLMMMIKQSRYIVSITTRKIGKLKTHSPTYCIMDNWENMLNLTHSTKYIWRAFYKFDVFR